MKWPTGAPVICGGPPFGKSSSSWRVSKPMVRCEWMTPFGSRVVPEVKPMIAGGRGRPERTGDRIAVEHRVERARAPGRQLGRRRVADHQPPGRRVIGHERLVGGEVVVVAEAVGGHDHRRRDGAEDVVDLLGPVEVHDRHDDRTEVGRRPERDAGLHPVRELEHDDVAGPDAVGAQRTGQRRAGRSTSANVPRHGRTFERTLKAMSPRRPRPRRPVAEGVVVPPPLGAVARGEVLGTGRRCHWSCPPMSPSPSSGEPRRPTIMTRVRIVIRENLIIVRVHGRRPVTLPAPRRGRDHEFHPLRVARVIDETPEARSYVLDVPDELRPTFGYAAGQFCTFRAPIDGEPPTASPTRCGRRRCEVHPDLQVTVKRVPGGRRTG